MLEIGCRVCGAKYNTHECTMTCPRNQQNTNQKQAKQNKSKQTKKKKKCCTAFTRSNIAVQYYAGRAECLGSVSFYFGLRCDSPMSFLGRDRMEMMDRLRPHSPFPLLPPFLSSMGRTLSWSRWKCVGATLFLT